MQPQSPQSPLNQNPEAPSQSGIPPMPTPQPIAMPTSAAPASSPAMQAQPVAAAQPAVQAADDGDIIEREWVNRVRQIIAATAQDPYLQNKQLTELKAEYMQKRYNKVIKISD